MTEAVQLAHAPAISERASLNAPLPVPWRDPHTVKPGELAVYISHLEQACREHPNSPGLRTCLGMAYAMNLDVYKSMDALDTARHIDKEHFWAQMKYAELLYRLRALPKAEEETLAALNLAASGLEFGVARRQLQEIRRLIREGTQKPAWTRPLTAPALWLAAFAGILCVAFTLGAR
ncbi:MAG: hypothetical protein U0Q16_18505 [Bryobacteraceae bacterium]